jgi:hypothetical protein
LSTSSDTTVGRVDLERCHSYREASIRASELAKTHRETTWVRRADIGWSVAVSSALADLLHAKEVLGRSTDATSSGDDEDAQRFACDDYQQGLDEEVMDDIEDDRDDWARSEEEGWYYGDE